jgi:hypothetical protein
MSRSSTSTRALSLVGVAALAALAVWHLISPAAAPADDPTLLLDRPWFDSKPDKYTDYVQAFYASRYSQTSVFQKASAYDFHFELATFRRDGSKLALAFPQTGKTADVTYTVRACNDLPPFDLCLDLDRNPWGGPKRYFAMKAQEDESTALGKAGQALRLHAGE